MAWHNHDCGIHCPRVAKRINCRDCGYPNIDSRNWFVEVHTPHKGLIKGYYMPKILKWFNSDVGKEIWIPVVCFVVLCLLMAYTSKIFTVR